MATDAAGRWVLHLDLDAFFASAEQLTRPTLRGRPVLVGGIGARGVVAGASYEARALGAHSAMPMHQARRLAGPSAVILPPRRAVITALSEHVFEIVRAEIPVYEQLSVDEAFGEPAGLAGANITEVREFSEHVRRRIAHETGLVASIGGGSGKQLAKIASGLAKPDGVRVISPDEQPGLLASLPVRKLWGIGPVAGEKLRRIGIETVGALAAMQEREVVAVLGAAAGSALHQLARGVDQRPVAQRAETKQISAETTFASDVTTLDALRTAVAAIATAAHARLTSDGRAARTVVLKLKKADMSVLSRSVTLPYATAELPVLLAAAQRSVIDPVELGPVRLAGVGFAGLSAVAQETLFPGLDAPEIVDDIAAPAAARAGVWQGWQPGTDVSYPGLGHGWVQGSGHGVVTVRFETRSTGPGPARTFPADDPALVRADPLDSLN